MNILAVVEALPAAGELGFPLEAVIVFLVVVAMSLAADLLLHRNGEEVSLKSAAGWSLFWIALSLGFYGYVFARFGQQWADLYLAGYVMEKTLSVDNLMVFMAIFSFFGIRGGLQHRILYWGILGALLFRAAFVLAGSLLLYFGAWADLVFGLFVTWSGVMMLRELAGRSHEDDGPDDYENYLIVRLARKVFPVHSQLVGDRFFVKSDAVGVDSTTAGRSVWMMTPAFVCLLVIEASDVLFAFDSVPAVIAITREPLLVYASMIFAILGLRSLYFVLSALTKYLVHLEKAVVALLFFIGGKMLLHASRELSHMFTGHAWTEFDINAQQSLYVILGVLLLGVIASRVFPGKARPSETETAPRG